MRGAVLILLLLAVVACSGGQGGGAAGAHEASAARGGGPVGGPVDTAAPSAHRPTPPYAVARARELRLVDGDGTRTLAHLQGEEGQFEHAALRPGDRESDTVLALVRTRDGYRLRYLVIDEHGEAGDLYGFPWRLQVDEDLADHADVPPLPVWAPDGSAVAWLEWDEDGTLLRTVGWTDEGDASNPSDVTATYRLDEVPVGAQLQRWEDGGRTPVLVADDGEIEWRIELEPGRQAIALGADAADR